MEVVAAVVVVEAALATWWVEGLIANASLAVAKVVAFDVR